MSKIIEVIVSPTGQTRVQTKGFAGSECRDASKAIEQALGGRLSEQVTSEFHESAPTMNGIQVQSRGE